MFFLSSFYPLSRSELLNFCTIDIVGWIILGGGAPGCTVGSLAHTPPPSPLQQPKMSPDITSVPMGNTVAPSWEHHYWLTNFTGMATCAPDFPITTSRLMTPSWHLHPRVLSAALTPPLTWYFNSTVLNGILPLPLQPQLPSTLSNVNKWNQPQRSERLS